MNPWILTMAGVLANKMMSANARQDAAAQIMQQNAERLGGNTDMVQAARASNNIDSQEAGAMANTFIGHLGRTMAEKDRVKAANASGPSPNMAVDDARTRATGLDAGGVFGSGFGGPPAGDPRDEYEGWLDSKVAERKRVKGW